MSKAPGGGVGEGVGVGGGGGGGKRGISYNGLYGEAPPGSGPFFSLWGM